MKRINNKLVQSLNRGASSRHGRVDDGPGRNWIKVLTGAVATGANDPSVLVMHTRDIIPRGAVSPVTTAASSLG